MVSMSSDLDLNIDMVKKNTISRLQTIFSEGTVSGSGTGPLDYGATGPVPDTEPRL